MKSSTSCKVYFSLLALCYLEVVLWTSCLFSPAAALAGTSDSHSYLIRETVRGRTTAWPERQSGATFCPPACLHACFQSRQPVLALTSIMQWSTARALPASMIPARPWTCKRFTQLQLRRQTCSRHGGSNSSIAACASRRRRATGCLLIPGR